MKMITERLKFVDVFPDKAAGVAQRLHIKKDEIPFVRKYYTAERGKTEVKKKERAVVSYISTGIKDRDGEKLLPEGAILENYLKNPVVPFAHNYKSIPPAKNMWLKRDEKGLVAKTIFAKSKQAEEYYQAYSEDIGGTGPLLNAFSVGFIPIDWTDTEAKALEKDPDLPKRIYNKWELLEYSLVPIPSCPEALTIAVEKGLFSEKLMKELEIEVVKDVPTGDEIDETTDKLGKALKGRIAQMIDEGEIYDKEIEVEVVTHPIAKEAEEAETISREQEIEIEKDEKEFKGVTAVWREGEEADYNIDEKGNIITKPETLGKYHHIPVNPGCKITATITISADKGIKATYCGEVKKIHTYLFDIKKWTMKEAQAWVKENHKGFAEAWEKFFAEGIEPEKQKHKEMIKEAMESIESADTEELEKETEEENEEGEKQEEFKCECIECGHKLTSEKHCKDIKCPECGGQMRRVERPGPGQASVSEESEALRADESDEFEVTKDSAIGEQQGEELETESTEFEEAVSHICSQYEKIVLDKDFVIAELKDVIAELKEGRVLSRKHRDIVKAAITALSAVLKADATGEREDTESDGEGTVTEREPGIDIIKDDEKELSKEDIVDFIKAESGPALVEAVKQAVKENLDPKKLKEAMKDIVRTELLRIRGKVV